MYRFRGLYVFERKKEETDLNPPHANTCQHVSTGMKPVQVQISRFGFLFAYLRRSEVA